MAIISSFLCWSNTRTGSAVCGYYTLVISVVCLAFYMLRYIALDEMKDSLELKGIVYAGFVLYSFLIGVSLILLPGVYMDRKLLLLPWIYVLVISVLYETGAIALTTTVHLEKDHNLSPWEIVAVVFYCLRLAANCYCFACVVSQYQELSEGRGTYEFLFKPRRRAVSRGLPVSDLDEYHPPYGATLPPYSEVNPYKEFSPPTYENLALEEEGRRWQAATQSLYGLRGAASASCVAEVVVNSPPPGFEEIDLYGDDDDSNLSYYTHYNHHRHSQPHHHHHHHYHHHPHHQQQHHHRLGEDLNYQPHHLHPDSLPYRSRRQTHQELPPSWHRGHHRHRSLPHTYHTELDFGASGDSADTLTDLGGRSKPATAASPAPSGRRSAQGRRLDIIINPHYTGHDDPLPDPLGDPIAPSLGSMSDLSVAKDPITMTESSGSLMSCSQTTDFRTPTPKSSPASVHSCHRLALPLPPSPPAIQKRTYITWI